MSKITKSPKALPSKSVKKSRKMNIFSHPIKNCRKNFIFFNLRDVVRATGGMLSDNEELPPVSSDEEAEKPVKRRVGRPTKHRFTDRGVAKLRTLQFCLKAKRLSGNVFSKLWNRSASFELSEQFSNANTWMSSTWSTSKSGILEKYKFL